MERFESYHERRAARRHHHSGLVPGLILVGIGALFFLNNLHIIYVREWIAYWPTILIAAGIVKLVDSQFMGGRVAGGVLVGVGVLLVAINLGYVDIRPRDLWPLALIAVGVFLLLQRVSIVPGQGWGSTAGTDENVLKLDAFFGGGKRKVTTQDFRGGTISATFGGYEIDLRKADIVGDTATLEVNCTFGGAEIKIPETWNADVQGSGIFGAFTDESLHPGNAIPNTKTLIVRGAAVFGGVEVKN
jgi:hypothetical protein